MKHSVTDRFRRTAVAALAIVALMVGGTSFTDAPHAQAATGSDFQPGNIISDQNFHNSNSMSAAQIQSFLNSKVSKCASGFTCLRSYSQTTYSKAASGTCGAYVGAANETASAIIYRVGLACGINPQVLLVLLQKEQLLISSTSPSQFAFDHATGYACPDTAACNPAFAGFFDQVYHAALQFGYYETHPNEFRYKKGSTVAIQYHPNPNCGTKQVFIENQATANLYIYTPYVPNAAALNNMYGTGDSCSSYGNRNFWSIFSDWFGSPSGPKSLHGSLDFAAGVLGGIQLQGWAIDPYNDGPTYIWINLDGAGRPAASQVPLNWIETLYPGKGANHGFDLVLPANPGVHQVCVLQTSGTTLGCSTVTVPNPGSSVGQIEEVTSGVGTITVRGWSLDKTSAAQGYVWVNVDGTGGPAETAVDLPWTAATYPGTGTRHGFSVTARAEPGRHQVCVYGANSVLLGCKYATVSPYEAGAITAATGVVGGVQLTGWTLDQRTSAPTYVWVAVDGGAGFPLAAAQASSAAAAAFPAVPGNHGFATLVAAGPGRHSVCVSGTSGPTSYGCKQVTVPNNEVGYIDSVTGEPGVVVLAGWSLDQTSADSTYVWVDIDGRGMPVFANASIPWINVKYPGVGPFHGISARLPTSPGNHRVCITGTKEGVPLGCFAVDVPSTGAANLDSVVVSPGKVSLAGWAVDRASIATTYLWVTIDGAGFPVRADNFLPWIDTYFPGVGSNHGFNATVDVSTGSHTVCVVHAFDNSDLGCRVVVVP